MYVCIYIYVYIYIHVYIHSFEKQPVYCRADCIVSMCVLPRHAIIERHCVSICVPSIPSQREGQL